QQKNQKARQQTQAEQVAQISSQQQIEKYCSNRKDQANQPFGQNVERHGGGQAPADQNRWLFASRRLFKRREKEIKADCQPQSHQHFRDQKARVDERSKAGAQRQRSV